MQRFSENRAALHRARELARARGDDERQVVLLLEEADMLDECSQWEQAATIVERALAQVKRVDTDEILSVLHLACGRTHFRREQYSNAVELLASAADRASAVGDRESRTKALLFLAPALLSTGDVDQAAQRFDQLIGLCRHTGDGPRLAFAHLNRSALWLRRQSIEQMVADLQTAETLARQLGLATVERTAALRWAETLYWNGRFDQALALASRSRDLYLANSCDCPMYEDHLLLARILCSQGDSQAVAYLRWVEDKYPVADLPPSGRALLTMVRLAANELGNKADDRAFDHDAWSSLYRSLHGDATRELQIEVALVAAEVLRHQGRLRQARIWCDHAATSAAKSRLWQARLNVLKQQLS